MYYYDKATISQLSAFVVKGYVAIVRLRSPVGVLRLPVAGFFLARPSYTIYDRA